MLTETLVDVVAGRLADWLTKAVSGHREDGGGVAGANQDAERLLDEIAEAVGHRLASALASVRSCSSPGASGGTPTASGQ